MGSPDREGAMTRLSKKNSVSFPVRKKTDGNKLQQSGQGPKGKSGKERENIKQENIDEEIKIENTQKRESFRLLSCVFSTAWFLNQRENFKKTRMHQPLASWSVLDHWIISCFYNKQYFSILPNIMAIARVLCHQERERWKHCFLGVEFPHGVQCSPVHSLHAWRTDAFLVLTASVSQHLYAFPYYKLHIKWIKQSPIGWQLFLPIYWS